VKIHKILIYAFIFITIFSAAAAAAEEISLEESVKILNENNRELINSRKDIENAEADIDLALRSFFPTLTLDNSYTKLDEGREPFNPQAEGSDSTYSNSLRFTQPVWFGNEVLLNKDIAELRIETARANYESLLEEKIFSLIQSY